MAVVMQMRWPGITAADYDKAREVVGWERDHPHGGRDHVAWFDSDGVFHVIDVWDSEEDFQRFADERLMPGLSSAGILEGKDEPEVTFAPLHRWWSPIQEEALA
jgi:hypothetical protein